MKASELRELTKDELIQKKEDIIEELFNLRMRNATNAIENPRRIRTLKRDAARINTILSELERKISLN